MGARLEFEVLRRGFYPRGGGAIHVRVTPGPLRPLALESRGALRGGDARAYLAALPAHIAERELAEVQAAFGWPAAHLVPVPLANDEGPGNALVIALDHEEVTEVVAGFGERGVRAEEVAAQAIAEARSWLAADVAVGSHLADQLLLPMALAGGGSFTTLTPTEHFHTNVRVIARFLPFDVQLTPRGSGVHAAVATEAA